MNRKTIAIIAGAGGAAAGLIAWAMTRRPVFPPPDGNGNGDGGGGGAGSGWIYLEWNNGSTPLFLPSSEQTAWFQIYNNYLDIPGVFYGEVILNGVAYPTEDVVAVNPGKYKWVNAPCIMPGVEGSYLVGVNVYHESELIGQFHNDNVIIVTPGPDSQGVLVNWIEIIGHPGPGEQFRVHGRAYNSGSAGDKLLICYVAGSAYPEIFHFDYDDVRYIDWYINAPDQPGTYLVVVADETAQLVVE